MLQILMLLIFILLDLDPLILLGLLVLTLNHRLILTSNVEARIIAPRRETQPASATAVIHACVEASMVDREGGIVVRWVRGWDVEEAGVEDARVVEPVDR